MFKIQVLDCTLRDGGYINQWKFGKVTIKKTIDSLVNANIDIIELGFLTNSVSCDENATLFSSIQDASDLISNAGSTSGFVIMINHGDYEINSLPMSDNTIGIRFAFHKHDLSSAIEQSETILQKGYKLFLQPMVINAYTSNEISVFIESVNVLKPWAVYIVDSFGVLSPHSLRKFVKLFDASLINSVKIGFHSHNNKQLSMANSIAFIDSLNRDCIVDSSIYGMGRGAGNLNTEIIVDYINTHRNDSYYQSLNLLEVIENYYYPQQYKTPWGYSLPFYLSAKYQLHPNYAKYLIELDTLNIEEVEQILEKISVKDRNVFDSELIQKRYITHQSSKGQDNFKNLVHNINFKENLVIVLPGESYTSAVDEMNGFSKSDYTILSVNFIPNYLNIDYVFISNTKRINHVKDTNINVIKTSNVNFEFKNQESIRYSDHINDLDDVKDNALLMLMSYLKKYKFKQIIIAGLDGYDPSPNHSIKIQSNQVKIADNVVLSKNKNIELYLKEYEILVKISTITPPKFIMLNLV